MIRPRAHLESLHRTPDDPESHYPYLRLDKNERVIPFPDDILQEFRELVTGDTIMAYPELGPVYARLATHLGVEPRNLLLAHGSDLAIKTVYETYVAPGDRVLLHSPCYAMHEVYGRVFQADIHSISFDTHLQLDVEAFAAAITSDTRLVLMENPNGFIGTIQSPAAIRRIVAKAHTCGAVMLLDEAYYLFSRQTVQSLFQEFDNVIIVRTFSKDLGLAGLRCGYLLSQPQNISALSRVRPMHEITSVASALVMALLDRPDHIDEFVAATEAGRRYLHEELQRMGLRTEGHSANFLVVYLGGTCDLRAVIAELKSAGILVRRPFQTECLRGWLRVGIGSVPQMQRFSAALADAIVSTGGLASSGI